MKKSIILVLILLVVLTFTLVLYAEDTTSLDTEITSGEFDHRDVTVEWKSRDNLTSNFYLIYSYKLTEKNDNWTTWDFDKNKSYTKVQNGKGGTSQIKSVDTEGNIDSAKRSSQIYTLEEPGKIVYVSDRDNHRIQAFTKKGDFLFKWGEEGSENGQFSSPFDLAVDSKGYVYVVDTGNNRIQIFDSTGSYIKKWDASFNEPKGIAIYENKAIISDSGNNRVVVLNKNDGSFIREWNKGESSLKAPKDVATDNSGRVYVVGEGQNSGSWSGYERFQVFSIKGEFIGSAKTDLGSHGITVDSQGYIYVTAAGNQTVADDVTKYDRELNKVTEWGTLGHQKGEFVNPWGLATDEKNNVYVVDPTGAIGPNNRVQVFTSRGDFIRKWGDTGSENGYFREPIGIAISKSTGDNPMPVTSASDITGIPNTMNPDITYSVSAKYYDPDGRADLNHCYLRLNHPEKLLTMMWNQSDGTYSTWAGEKGQNYLTIEDVEATKISNGNEGYELTWKFKINDQWPKIVNSISFGVSAKDNRGLTSGWDYDNGNTSFLGDKASELKQKIDEVVSDTTDYLNSLSNSEISVGPAWRTAEATDYFNQRVENSAREIVIKGITSILSDLVEVESLPGKFAKKGVEILAEEAAQNLTQKETGTYFREDLLPELEKEVQNTEEGQDTTDFLDQLRDEAVSNLDTLSDDQIDNHLDDLQKRLEANEFLEDLFKRKAVSLEGFVEIKSYLEEDASLLHVAERLWDLGIFGISVYYGGTPGSLLRSAAAVEGLSGDISELGSEGQMLSLGTLTLVNGFMQAERMVQNVVKGFEKIASEQASNLPIPSGKIENITHRDGYLYSSMPNESTTPAGFDPHVNPMEVFSRVDIANTGEVDASYELIGAYDIPMTAYVAIQGIAEEEVDVRFSKSKWVDVSQNATKSVDFYYKTKDSLFAPEEGQKIDFNLLAETKNGVYGGPALETVWSNTERYSMQGMGIMGDYNSPGEFRIYDSKDNVTGLVNGSVKEEIPNSIFDKETQSALVFPAKGSFKYELVSEEGGEYGFNVVKAGSMSPNSLNTFSASNFSNQSSVNSFSAIDISTSSGATHQYTADWQKLSQGEDGVTIKTDEDGDGTYEDEMNVGNAFSGMEAGTNIKKEFTNQGITLVFDEVTSRGFTNINVLKKPDFNTSSGIHLVGDTYKFSTTASYSGNINITLSYDDSYLTSRKEGDLKLFKIDESGNVKDITTSQDKYNNTVTGTTEGFSHFVVGYRDTESLAEGWNIFSPPGAPLNPDPSAALGDDLDNLNLFYDYGEGGYTSYPTDTTDTQLFWRQGYWMYLSEYRDVDMDVTSPESDLTIQFQEPGWKLIGAPYPVNWSKASFSDPSHFDSDGSGNVRLISWNPYEERYLYHYSDTSYVLDPWRGYWIKVNEASSDEPATINLSETSSSPASVGTKTPLPQSVDRDELDKPPAPPDPADTKDQLELVAFPNPAGNTDEIRFGLNISEDAVDRIKVKVFNSSGTLRWSARSEGSVLTWNCEGTPNGIYLYQGSVKVDGTWRKLGVKKLLVLK